MRRLAAFPAKGHWRQVRAIGFDHEFPEWNLRGHFPNILAVLKSNDPRERNEMIEFEDFVGLLERAAKAMENAAHFAGVRPHDIERVLPGVSLMNDHV